MGDKGHEQTDKELKRIEKLITKEYKTASKELDAKLKQYFADFGRKDAKMAKMMEDGDITEQEYKQWRIGQMATGKRWESLRDSMTETLVNADKNATKIIQGQSIKAYGDNMNYGTYEVEHGSKIDTGFVLYDEKTIENLLKSDPKIIPMPKLDIPKDELWNRQKLTSAVTQGILQGESIPKIADRLQNVAMMDRNSALRNARTYTTAAENKGRIDSYERAKDLGIQTNKKWIATLDDRTRVEHRHLDNMSVPNDEPFVVDGFSINFPGDPSAEPEMFYNCRCTLVADIVNYNYNDERNDEKLGDMSYEEWKHAKDVESKEETKQISTIIFADNVKDETKELIYKLESEYNTRLGEVKLGSDKGAGDVDIAGYTMRLSSEKAENIIHEFAHTMANSSADKFGLTNDAEFWKEIDKIKREYRKDVGQDTSRWISSYEHGRNDKDEFFAEAFAMAKMKEMGIEIPDKYGNDFTYADKVLEIVDRYFGKEEQSESIGETLENILPLFVEVHNKQEAKEQLEKIFGSVESNFMKNDERLIVENTNQLLKLNARFNAITENNTGYLTASPSGRAMGYTSSRFVPDYNGRLDEKTNLGLVGKYYKDYDFLIQTEERSIEKFWSMPSAQDNLSIYTVTHEYGHILQNSILVKRTDYDELQKKVDSMTKPSAQQTRSIYQKAEKSGAKDIFNEIVAIAKERNPDFSLKDNLSEYGHTNHFEAFAEIFANSQCGEPNELGSAMQEWLKKEGF